MLIGYARVSTDDQDHALQLDALRQAGCETVFTETASGAKRNRPQLKAALAAASEGDTLVVWKTDRLARDVEQMVETLGALRARGIGYRSLTDPIDASTPVGRFVFHLLAAFAELERAMLQDRTREGLKAARARGRVGGRPKALSPEDLNSARERLRDPASSFKAVAEEFGVCERTLRAYFPGGRRALLDVGKGEEQDGVGGTTLRAANGASSGRGN